MKPAGIISHVRHASRGLTQHAQGFITATTARKQLITLFYSVFAFTVMSLSWLALHQYLVHNNFYTLLCVKVLGICHRPRQKWLSQAVYVQYMR